WTRSNVLPPRSRSEPRMQPALNGEPGELSRPRSEFPPRKARSLVRGAPGSFSGLATPDAIFRKACAAFAVAILALLGLIVFEIASGARPSVVRFGLGFVAARVWDPVAERFGAAPFVFGTVVSSLIALLLAVPYGVGIAVFLVEIAPRRVRGPVGF